MSYSTSNNFLLINKISPQTLYDNLFKHTKILLDIHGDSTEHLTYINGYINNLVKKDVLDISINNSLINKIIYYVNSDKYPDTYVIDNNKIKLYNIIDIDNSFYASETIKKYMFIYDFLGEYYRNLSLIKKNKYAIDNKSLYEHTFNMKIRYKYKTNFSGGKTIININNDDNDIYYYLISFKLEDQNSKNSDDELLIQPTGFITELKINNKTYIDDNETIKDLTDSQQERFLQSFKDLFNDLITTKDLKIDSELSYYHILAESYKFKFYKLLLSYYVSKIIYFYYKQNYKTKIKEIDTIIAQHYPKAFQNFDIIINDSSGESLITIMKNSQKKIYIANKNKQKDLDKLNYSLSKLKIDRDKISNDVDNKGLEYSENKLTNLQLKYAKINEEIAKLELEYETTSEKDYITQDSAQIQEAIGYKSKLHTYNENILNNSNNIKRLQETTKSEDKYINNLDIVNYFIVFLLIILIFIFILDYSTTIVNVSIPITLLALTIVSYLIINYALKNRFNGNTNQHDFGKNQSVIQSLFNTIGGKYLENFEDDIDDTILTNEEEQQEVELDPIVQDIVENSLTVGDNNIINQMGNLLDSKIEADIEQKLYFNIPNTDYKIDIINELIHGTDISTSDIAYSYFWTGYPTVNTAENGIPEPVLKSDNSTSSTSSNDNKIIFFANDQSDEMHTIYTFNIPKGLDYFSCAVIVVGGGSFGGHIAQQEEFDDTVGGALPATKNMGEGGAGGAVIYQQLNLTPGKYELGVGRGGIWKTNLYKSIAEGQAASSYIKNKDTGVIYILAKGAQYEEWDQEASSRGPEKFNQQLSGGKITGNIDKIGNINESLKNGIGQLGSKNNYSNGGRGGLIKPAEGQVGFTYLSSLGSRVDTYYLSSYRYPGDENGGTNGNDGIDFSDIFTPITVSGGGGASSYCKDGEDTTFHEVNGKFYTCSASADRSGKGGLGGGGDGNPNGIGSDAVHGSGGGGGGGKTAGGNGGAGIIILKFNIVKMREKLMKGIDSTKLKLQQTIYELGIDESNKELRKKKIAIASYLREINNFKNDIADKYKDIGVLIDQGEDAGEGIETQQQLIRDAEVDQKQLKGKILQYNREINEYNQKVAQLTTDKKRRESELKTISAEFDVANAQFIKKEASAIEKEAEEKRKETNLAQHKAEYLKNISNKLKAEACKKAFRAAELNKAKEIIQNRKMESEMKRKMLEEAEEKRVKAIKDTIAAEKLRDQALNEQYEAEKKYKETKKELIEWEQKQEITRENKSYTVSFRLEIDFRIAGIHGFDDSFFDGIDDDANITAMRKSLEKEKIKRENFITNIKKELTFATSELYGGTLPNRYSILRIHSGNLEKREDIETEEEAEERRKMKIISNFEKSKYDNEFNKKINEGFQTFSNFETKEHFVIEEDKTEEELLFRTRTQGYIPPDNVMVIELQILAHPQSKHPYADEILDELILQSNRLDSKLRSNGRYFRFLNGYKVQDEDWVLVEKGRGITGNVDILIMNKNKIDNIIMNFGIIKNLQADLPSYYDNVNPLLKKETRVYNDKNHKISMYNKLSKNSQNVRFIDIRKKELTINFILSLCILISTTSILLKMLNNPIIFIIFIVILICIIIYYVFNMTRIVNTKYKNNYWLKPEKIKLVNASDE